MLSVKKLKCVLSRSRLNKRKISSGCQFSRHVLRNPHFQNVFRVTSTQPLHVMKLQRHIIMLYGDICAYQPSAGQQNCCFVSFKDKTDRYNAKYAKVKDFKFESIPYPSFPCEHVLFPCMATVTYNRNFHQADDIIKYVASKAGDPESFNSIFLRSNTLSDPDGYTVYINFSDPEVYKRVVPDHTVHSIPMCNSTPFQKEVDMSLLSRYLPLYLNDKLASKISSILFEWDGFKRVDSSIIFKIFESIGTVNGFESVGKNQVLVHYEKLNQSKLFTAFTKTSLFGRGELQFSDLNKGWSDNTRVSVYIPYIGCNPMFAEEILPFIHRNSVSLYNIRPNSLTYNMDTVPLVGHLLNRVLYNPGFVSATFFPEDEKIDVLFEQPADVDKVISRINERGGKLPEVILKDIRAERCVTPLLMKEFVAVRACA